MRWRRPSTGTASTKAGSRPGPLVPNSTTFLGGERGLLHAYLAEALHLAVLARRRLPLPQLAELLRLGEDGHYLLLALWGGRGGRLVQMHVHLTCSSSSGGGGDGAGHTRPLTCASRGCCTLSLERSGRNWQNLRGVRRGGRRRRQERWHAP